MKQHGSCARLQQPQSLLEHVRQFLTPQVWKQARHAVPGGRPSPRGTSSPWWWSCWP